MQKTKEQNYNLFYNTIKSLSYSQGSYGRLLREIDSLDDWNKQLQNLKLIRKHIKMR